jgi:beta-glucanase (GH16 family)
MHSLRTLLVFSACLATPFLASAQATSAPQTIDRAATPTFVTRKALAGAEVVSLKSTSPQAVVHYTVDGSKPTASSPIFQAPFLVAARTTVQAVAMAAGKEGSAIASRTFAPNIPAGTLVWSDEFSNATGRNQEPDPSVWGYDTGNNGFGNHELEDYCAWGSAAAPCDPAQPNAFVGTDGCLHIAAREPKPGVYTSARLKSQGLFSVQYGRLEARIRAPEAQGLWPAFWTLGNNIVTANWPACGEQDIFERVNGALTPDWNEGSIHGIGFVGDAGLGTKYFFPAGQTTAGWHTYGIIWKKDSAAFYVDDPAHPYVTYTNPESIAKFPGAKWPFDSGDSAFFLLNLAVGGDWPGKPDAKTKFPAELLVDYVRVYAE